MTSNLSRKSTLAARNLLLQQKLFPSRFISYIAHFSHVYLVRVKISDFIIDWWNSQVNDICFGPLICNCDTFDTGVSKNIQVFKWWKSRLQFYQSSSSVSFSLFWCTYILGLVNTLAYVWRLNMWGVKAVQNMGKKYGRQFWQTDDAVRAKRWLQSSFDF